MDVNPKHSKFLSQTPFLPQITRFPKKNNTGLLSCGFLQLSDSYFPVPKDEKTQLEQTQQEKCLQLNEALQIPP